MISITVLGLIMAISSSIYVNFFGSMRNLKAANNVYGEARFLMERVVREVRNGTIDYEEYYHQNLRKNLLGEAHDAVRNETYAQEYCDYSLQFYGEGDDNEIGTFDDEPTGELAVGALPAIGRLDGFTRIPSPIQNDLFLININGNERTYLKRIEKEVDGQIIGKVGILKLVGGDFGMDHIDAFASTSTNCSPDLGENDGRIDTWLCEDGFNCTPVITLTVEGCNGVAGHTIVSDPNNPDENSFVDITPASLDIVDIKFIVSPMDDPRKAFNMNEVQIQPHVTVKIIARANPLMAAQFRTEQIPDIILESTVSARAMNEIITECNLKQCITGLSAPKPCPLSDGVCDADADDDDGITEPAQQNCENYLWTGCSAEDYRLYAENEHGLSDPAQGDGYLYQERIEYESCEGDDACQTYYCTDGHDNNCNGLTDENDPACKFYLCNNGLWEDTIEECRDVGGICEQIRSYEEGQEFTCDDNYDNDCDGYADEFDPDCIIQFCTDKLRTPEDPLEELFLTINEAILPIAERSYLYDVDDFDTALNEECIDVGGICDLCLTDDGLTSCECGVGLCTNNKIVTASVSSANETGSQCYDGLDNDCDDFADEFDDDCTSVICANNAKNCDIAPDGYEGDKSYLVDYTDTQCVPPPLNFNDEVCIDVGGLCNGFREVIESKYKDHTLINKEDEPDTYDPPTSPVHTCTDDLDNDCDNLTDWEDTDCCPDGDGDGYADGTIDTCKHESEGGKVPDGVFLDCDDTMPSINPDAAEVCDGVADNNCSFLNFGEGLTDDSDDECCVDIDKDGYGVEDAYLSCPMPEPDCDDTDDEIHPGKLETGGICFNEDGSYPINDNCKYTGDYPRANHMDWYYGKNNAWFILYGNLEGFDTTGLSTSGIAAAYDLGLFDPDCCNFSAVEICNDNAYGSYGSDDNCNGLEGEADHYCLNMSGLRFFDNFTSSSFISTLGAGVVQNTGAGNITLSDPTDSGMVTSSVISLLNVTSCTDYQVSISPSTTIPAGTDIQFQLSGDNGVTWCGDSACDGSDWILMAELPISVSFSNPDYTLRWRALLDGDDATLVPVLNNISISYQCL